MKQTAVEYLESIINHCKKYGTPIEQIDINQAKQMERKYIVKCCMITMETCNSEMNKLGCKTMDDYFNFVYNETFKSE